MGRVRVSQEDKNVEFRISEKRFKNSVKRKKRKKHARRIQHELHVKLKKEFGGDFSFQNLISKWLPPNLKYLLNCEYAGFSHSIELENYNGKIKIPKNFSLIDNSDESYFFIKKIVKSILSLKYKKIEIDYSECKNIDLGAQIYLDIILKDIIKFINRCNSSPINSPKFPEIGGIEINNDNIMKMLFSVGSPAIHTNNQKQFDDIIAYKLCIHNKRSNANKKKNLQRKEIDSTELMDYVIQSLDRVGKKLTMEKIEDFSTVIGEILINAEEHSTTQHRFSTGYFQEHLIGKEHFGIFNLIIINFGETIYQKFISPNCKNFDILEKMKELSEKYTKKKIFSDSFNEESLWTLYALQEGITSVSKERYKRGNGSIRFIESFFNIKGVNGTNDNISRMTILSGNTNITFDGTYSIANKGEFKVMTFNKTGNIEDKPDKKYVKHVKNYFPGTLISAKILINEDDIV
jgi:hypothetical protein